jgi:hypothetical protein
MLRRLFTVLSVLSLMLCTAVVVLWVRSYSAGEKVSYGWTVPPESRAVTLLAYTNRGMLYLSRYDVSCSGPVPPEFWGDPAGRLQWERYRPYPPLAPADRYLLGFRSTDASRATPLTDPPGVARAERWRIVAVPLWVPWLGLGVWPAARLWLWHRSRGARRLAKGLCPSCGYDLRATPGRCPECGTAVAADADAQRAGKVV